MVKRVPCPGALSTLLKVRDAGQLTRNDVEINLLRDKWANSRDRVVDIYTTVFEFKGADPPLSWHLTAAQREAIEASWQAEAGGCTDPESYQETPLERRNVKYGGWPPVRTFLTLGREEPPAEVSEVAEVLAAPPPARRTRVVSPNGGIRAGTGAMENLMRNAR